MDKQLVIAQLLYRMALFEKTQKRFLLTSRKKERLKKTLEMFSVLISMLKNEEPLTQDEIETLITYVVNHPEVFPILDSETMKKLKTMEIQIACYRVWLGDWDLVVTKMQELINYANTILSSFRNISNQKWIICFMAFHNLPRVFFSNDFQAIWHESIPSLDVKHAIQSANNFSFF